MLKCDALRWSVASWQSRHDGLAEERISRIDSRWPGTRWKTILPGLIGDSSGGWDNLSEAHQKVVVSAAENYEFDHVRRALESADRSKFRKNIPYKILGNIIKEWTPPNSDESDENVVETQPIKSISLQDLTTFTLGDGLDEFDEPVMIDGEYHSMDLQHYEGPDAIANILEEGFREDASGQSPAGITTTSKSNPPDVLGQVLWMQAGEADITAELRVDVDQSGKERPIRKLMKVRLETNSVM